MQLATLYSQAQANHNQRGERIDLWRPPGEAPAGEPDRLDVRRREAFVGVPGSTRDLFRASQRGYHLPSAIGQTDSFNLAAVLILDDLQQSGIGQLVDGSQARHPLCLARG